MAAGAPHRYLRAGTRLGLLGAWPVCGAHGNALRFGEYQSVAVLRHGELAARGGVRDARRVAGAPSERDPAARGVGGHSGASVGCVYHGSHVRARRGSVLSAGDGRRAHLGFDDKERGLGELCVVNIQRAVGMILALRAGQNGAAFVHSACG